MNPEKATDYLSKVNWKSLVEWLTAEAILNRPKNPVQFCRDLLGQKLAEQTDDEYKPDEVTDWLRNCYTEATALVDEHGVIHGKTLETAEQSLAEQVIDLKRKVGGMQTLLDATTAIANLDPHQATENIIHETCQILNCERASIFTADRLTNELVLSVAEGAKNIRVPIGQGIAGTVAATGETINIVDAYADSRFSSSADKASGFRTNTLLCLPIKSIDNTIVGVIQAINKNQGVFNSTDEDVMNLLATQAGIALQNAQLFRHAEAARDKFRSLLDIIRSMQGEVGVNSLIFTVTQRTIRVVEADRCTLFLIDNVQKGLFSMQGEVNIRIPMDSGIAGLVATQGKVLNIVDAYDNPNFNQQVDKKTGYRTKAILCMPIKCEDTIIGVIQLINKTTGGGVFTVDDEEIMHLFLSIAGPIIAESALYERIQGKSKGRAVEESGAERDGGKQSGLKKDNSKGVMSGFKEEEEEEEDD